MDGPTGLTVRKLPWEFDDDVPFLWHPENPRFSASMNAISFMAPAINRFVEAAIRASILRIADHDARAEADAFVRQEQTHAKAHRGRANALIRRYPGLRELVADLDACYDEILETKPLLYHLAYIADVEAALTPLSTVMLRHHDTLFDPGDRRVAPLFIWHLVEEIEHRSTAKIVYDAVCPFPWYRTRCAPGVLAHVAGCFNRFCRAVDEHVPPEDRGMDVTELVIGPSQLRRFLAPSGLPSMFDGVSMRERAAGTWRFARSQWPTYAPEDEPTPPIADAWTAAHARGDDVVDWYGSDDGVS